jgi:hypothetical protein
VGPSHTGTGEVGRFFASLDRRTHAWLVKLPAERVTALIAAGHAQPFAPAGRVFREWAALLRPDRRRWRTLVDEAKRFAAERCAIAPRRRSQGSVTPAQN